MNSAKGDKNILLLVDYENVQHKNQFDHNLITERLKEFGTVGPRVIAYRELKNHDNKGIVSMYQDFLAHISKYGYQKFPIGPVAYIKEEADDKLKLTALDIINDSALLQPIDMVAIYSNDKGFVNLSRHIIEKNIRSIFIVDKHEYLYDEFRTDFITTIVYRDLLKDRNSSVQQREEPINTSGQASLATEVPPTKHKAQPVSKEMLELAVLDGIIACQKRSDKALVNTVSAFAMECFSDADVVKAGYVSIHAFICDMEQRKIVKKIPGTSELKICPPEGTASNSNKRHKGAIFNDFRNIVQIPESRIKPATVLELQTKLFACHSGVSYWGRNYGLLLPYIESESTLHIGRKTQMGRELHYHPSLRQIKHSFKSYIMLAGVLLSTLGRKEVTDAECLDIIVKFIAPGWGCYQRLFTELVRDMAEREDWLSIHDISAKTEKLMIFDQSFKLLEVPGTMPENFAQIKIQFIYYSLGLTQSLNELRTLIENIALMLKREPNRSIDQLIEGLQARHGGQKNAWQIDSALKTAIEAGLLYGKDGYPVRFSLDETICSVATGDDLLINSAIYTETSLKDSGLPEHVQDELYDSWLTLN